MTLIKDHKLVRQSLLFFRILLDRRRASFLLLNLPLGFKIYGLPLQLLLLLLLFEFDELFIEGFLQLKQVVDLLDSGESDLGVDNLADREDLDRGLGRCLQVCHKLVAQAIQLLVLSLLLSLLLTRQLVTSVDDLACFSSGCAIGFVLCCDGIDV